MTDAALATAVHRSHDGSWEVREGAAALLGDHLGRPPEDLVARERLVELLDDGNTAVGVAAARVLVRRGGLDGLARVAWALAHGDPDAAEHIGDAFGNWWREPFPLRERVDALLAEPLDDATRAAVRTFAWSVGVLRS